jgi:hypothetical protein
MKETVTVKKKTVVTLGDDFGDCLMSWLRWWIAAVAAICLLAYLTR